MGLPTTLNSIADEELRLGCKLPQSVKSMLIENNGGVECITGTDKEEIWFLYAVKDTTSRKHISRSANHIEKETKTAREWYGFPNDAIALGDNGCGDYLVIRKRSQSIYIWRHETADILKTSIEPLT